MATTTTPSPSQLNKLAQKFKALHRPGTPVIVVNVWDAHSAKLAAQEPQCQAIATASWAIAATHGIDDDDLSYDENLAAVGRVVRGVANAQRTLEVPVTCDLQDGYADVARSVRAVIALGCVGCNIEDVDLSRGAADKRIRTLDDGRKRITAAVQAAADAGVPDFVVNARVDVLWYGGTLDDVVERARAYLDAGATTAFVWGPRDELDEAVVRTLCQRLDGRLAVLGPPRRKAASVAQLKTAGVARVSFGPGLFVASMDAFVEHAKSLWAQ